MNELSFELYKKLYLIRGAEQLIIEHYPEDEMKTPMHMSMGQEAVSVGVCYALEPQDQVFATYRSHATFLAKTGDSDRFFAELYGKVEGTAYGKAGSMHLAAPDQGHMCSSAIVGSCMPLAVGAAFANKQKGNGRISCVFFGDGALDEGVSWESINVACVMALPVLFICEDNRLAVHTPTYARQGYKSITDIVSKFECSVFRADTTDVEVIYRLALDAISSVKKIMKPVFVHLECYRYLEHVGIYEDYDAGYRPKSEFCEWYARDCVRAQRARLINNGHGEADVLRAERTIDEQLLTSVTRAKEAPFPPPAELYRGVFHEEN